MPTTSAASAATFSDNGVPALCPVNWATAIAQAVVKAADPEAWHRLWRVLEDGIDDAKDKARCTGTAYPWEEIENVQAIAWEDVTRTLQDAISVIQDVSERKKLVHAAERAQDALVARGAGRHTKTTRFGIKHCARCSRPFAAVSHVHAYCSTACRTGAYEARQRANGRGQANVSKALA